EEREVRIARHGAPALEDVTGRVQVSLDEGDAAQPDACSRQRERGLGLFRERHRMVAGVNAAVELSHLGETAGKPREVDRSIRDPGPDHAERTGAPDARW